MKIFYSLLFLSVSGWAGTQNLAPFETDYCTNYREGTRNKPEQWKHCCLIHDMNFWAGGTKQDRYSADLSLKNCVQDTGAYYEGQLMYLAVRSGSYSPIKYSNKRWNHGWRTRPNFQKLNVEDIDRIEAELLGGYDFITQEIKDSFVQYLRSRPE